VRELTAGYFEDFESYSAGSDPEGWLDTAANNTMVENDSLFEVLAVGADMVFGTSSTQSNIHSHYTDTTYDAQLGFEYSGRMRISASSGGIGVTLLSQYPSSDRYYRLRRYGSTAFHLSPHGTTVAGSTSTNETPVANAWYWFKVEVQDTGSRTEIRASVWAEGTDEPDNWQIDAYDNSATRLTIGKIGVWSYSSGSKYWDDLAVGPIF